MQCIVIIVLKIEPAGQVRYNKQQLNSQRRAKHVRHTIEMKSYPSLNSDTGCSNGWSSICDLFVAWALDVRDLLFLHSYIGRTPFSYPCVLCKKVRPIRAKIRYLLSCTWLANVRLHGNELKMGARIYASVQCSPPHL